MVDVCLAEIEPSRIYVEREHDVTRVTIEHRLTSAMKHSGDYALVPFEVVAGTARPSSVPDWR